MLAGLLPVEQAAWMPAFRRVRQNEVTYNATAA